MARVGFKGLGPISLSRAFIKKTSPAGIAGIDYMTDPREQPEEVKQPEQEQPATLPDAEEGNTEG